MKEKNLFLGFLSQQKMHILLHMKQVLIKNSLKNWKKHLYKNQKFHPKNQTMKVLSLEIQFFKHQRKMLKNKMTMWLKNLNKEADMKVLKEMEKDMV